MFCKNCGREMKDTEKFCPNCGQPVEEKSSESKMDATSSAFKKGSEDGNYKNGIRKKENKSKKWIFIIPFFIIIIAVVAFFILNDNSDKKEQKSTKNIQNTMESINDIEDLISITVAEAEKYGFSFIDESEDMMTNEDMSLMLICQDEKVIGANIESACSYPFHGVYIGDTIEEAKNKLGDEFQVSDEGESYLLAVNAEKAMSVWLGNSSTEESNVVESMEIQTGIDVDSIMEEDSSIDEETNEMYNTPEEETEVNASSEANSESFIGISGVYVCTNSDLDVTGRISIYQTGNSCDFVLDTLEMGYTLLSGSGKIVSSNTIQIEVYGMTITCTWSDSEDMYVTCSAIDQGMDAATLDNTINGRNYVYAAEFN